MINHTLAVFYNVENLYATASFSKKKDLRYTPLGSKRWTQKRLSEKVKKIALALEKLAQANGNQMPALVGLCEVENSEVIEMLLKTSPMQSFGYKYILYPSDDVRGLNLALLYTTVFGPIVSQALNIDSAHYAQEPTRDILHVKGLYMGVVLDVFVCHFPSQRLRNTKAKMRQEAAKKLSRASGFILQNNPKAHILIMGDFNENPDVGFMKTDFLESFKGQQNNTLSNGIWQTPMELLYNRGIGTLKYNGKWCLFDQMIFSNAFMDSKNGLVLEKAEVFNPPFLRDPRDYNRPFRTYSGSLYLGGVSDHFPIYAVLKKV